MWLWGRLGWAGGPPPDVRDTVMGCAGSASGTTTPASSPGLDEVTSSVCSRVTESQALSNARTCEVCPRLPEGHSLDGETRHGEVRCQDSMY